MSIVLLGKLHRDIQVDESGEFRLAGLEMGRYHLALGGRFNWPDQAKNRAYPVQIYPGAADLQSAKVIEVQAGQVEQLTLPLHVAAACKVRGRIPAGDENPGISLHPLGEPGAGTQFFNASWDESNESFTFPGVPPGVWILETDFSVDGRAVHVSKTPKVEDADLRRHRAGAAVRKGADSTYANVVVYE